MIHRDEWAIGGLALLARLIPIVLTRDLGIGLDDMLQYDELAQSLLAGRGYTWYGGIPTAFRAPLYPAFLAGIYGLFGHNLIAVRLVQGLLGAALSVITYRLSLHLYGDRRLARIAGALVALYTLLLIYPLGLVTENLFLPLVALGLLVTLKADRQGDSRLWAVSGVLWTAAILTRSVVSAFVPVILIWVWRGRAIRRQKAWATILLVLPVLALTLPWAVRNSLLFGQPIYVESALGFDLYMGYHPRSEGTFSADVAAEILNAVRAQERRDVQVEADINRVGLEEAIRFILQDPGRVPLQVGSKLSHFFRLDTRGVLYFYSNNFVGPLPPVLILLALAVLAAPTMLVWLGAAWGMVASGMRRETMLLNGFILYFVAVHAAILSEPRFHLPLIAILAVYAAYGYSRLAAWSKENAQAGKRPWPGGLPRGLAILAITLSLLLLANWGYQFWSEADRWAVVLAPGGYTGRFNY